jgi:purine-nucleoside/S-methyl-5'-thioadenosine phosphorylase / adenosine deaminase
MPAFCFVTPMEWRESDGLRWLEAELPGAKAVFSTRSTGSVLESRLPLAAALGLATERIAIARQVHGAELVFHQTSARKLDEADGHVISEPGLAGLVFVADCLPVALAGPGGVAILHCGWRGLAAGIVARGAEAVGATHAAIGPGVGPCCYEVGEEVPGAFAGLGEGVASGRMLDLAEVARRLLREAGVTRIESAGLCTSCEAELFFSHRRDAGRTGRQAGLVWLDGEVA